ncbi:MAG: carbamoyltransferase HypF, partial [Anaerolineae bacterium]
LLGDRHGFARVAHLEYLPMPGGDAAVRNPYRLGWAYVDHLLRDVAPDDGDAETLSERAILRRMVLEGVNTPWTSSAGRLFDAVSALLGVRDRVTYEAEAAVALEMLAEEDPDEVVYPYSLADTGQPETWGRSPAYAGVAREIGLAPLVEAVLAERDAGVPVGLVSHRFHKSLANMTAQVATLVARETGVRTVALSGGCFQNRLLLRLTRDALEEKGLAVLVHRQVPCNDGGISLGQVAIAQGVVGGA